MSNPELSERMHSLRTQIKDLNQALLEYEQNLSKVETDIQNINDSFRKLLQLLTDQLSLAVKHAEEASNLLKNNDNS